MTPKDRMNLVVDRLKPSSARPKTLTTLRSSIDAIFQKQVGELEIQAVIDQMIKTGYVSVTNEKVAYSFPSNA